jgi:hypothetical protein
MLDKRFFQIVGSAVAAVVCTLVQPAHAVTVTATGDATTLTDTLVTSGSGITVINSSYTGATNASGTFTGGGNIGIGSGVILTSGSATGATGPNTVGSFTGNNGVAGDADLSALIGNAPTFDASSLLLNFTTDTGTISFNYVFASEEYEEFVGSQFNDVFGFFVNGTNIAFLPSTSIAVSINNVNQNTNSTFYRSNTGAALNNVDTQYDGLTTVLSVSISGLSTTAVNTLKLSIADTADSVLDSAVFIQAGSITSQPPTVPEPSPLLATVSLFAGLLGLTIVKRRNDRKTQALS